MIKLTKLLNIALCATMLSSVMAPYTSTIVLPDEIDGELGNSTYVRSDTYFSGTLGCHIVTINAQNWPNANWLSMNLHCFPSTDM